MNHEERLKFVRAVVEEKLVPLLTAKGLEYSGVTDTNRNFKMIAEEVGDVDKYTVWNIYFQKHLFSLKSWMKLRQALAEPIEGRIYDLINYLFIFLTLLKEDQEKTEQHLHDLAEQNVKEKLSPSVKPPPATSPVVRYGAPF